MSSHRDDFDKSVVDVLAKRAAYMCSNPECRALTIAASDSHEGKFLYIGRAAHITAASPGGPRFDSAISPKERGSAGNGIFLCASCADMVDKNRGIDFSGDVLRGWKSEHEEWVRTNLNKAQGKESPPAQVFNVSTHNQRGGIAAGIVNIDSKARVVNQRLKAQLQEHLPDKSRAVTVLCVMGDGEALRFATAIKRYLLAAGYSTKGVNQALFREPAPPLGFNPTTNTFTIGARK